MPTRAGLNERYRDKVQIALTSTATPTRSPRWMRWSPISRCSAPWSISRPTTPPPKTNRTMTPCTYDAHASLRGQLGAGLPVPGLPRRGRLGLPSRRLDSATRPRCPSSTTITRTDGMAEVGKATSPDGAKARRRDRPVTGLPTTGHDWDGIQRAEPPAAALVAVDLLRDHRLRAGLGRRSIPPCPLSARRRPACSATPPAADIDGRDRPRPPGAGRAPRRRSRTCRSRRSRRTPISTASPSPAAARPSRSTASSAMAPARRAPKGYRQPQRR